MYKNHNMFFLILLALNSLFTSCTSTDKAPTDKSTTKVETVVKDMPTPSAKEAMVDIAESEARPRPTPTTDKTSINPEVRSNPTPEALKVKADQSLKTKAPKEVVKVTETAATTPIIETPQIVEKINEESFVNMDKPIKELEARIKPAVSHADFNGLLQKHVKNGLVNYAGFKADAAKFDAYLDYLSNNAPSTSDKSKSALAFWMNAYNAFTIKLIVDNLPVASIRDLHSGKPWDKKWITIGGKSYSLNNIEHDIIRPVFNEPRIHFAIVCAAKSCPPLDNQAFNASNVDANLERLTKQFINNPKFNTLTESKVTITPIMDWYGKDFGNVLAFVQKYATTTVGDNAKVKFTDYDWSLNKQ